MKWIRAELSPPLGRLIAALSGWLICGLMPALEPVQIDVRSYWQGEGRLDSKAITNLTIACASESCTTSAGSVKRDAVDALVSAFGLDPVDRVTASDLGITEETLTALARQTRQRIESDAYIRAYTPPGWLLAFERVCSDMKRIDVIVERYYNADHFWTDDYPSVRGEIVVGTQKLTFTSSAQQAFMVPWTLRDGIGRERKTYDLHFSRAVGELLPSGFVNRDRIRGTHINTWLEGEIRRIAYQETAPPR